MTKQEFIGTILEGAKEVQRQTGMLTSITLAQAIWETGGGGSTPKDVYTGEESYNLFGRKAAIGDPYVTSRTWEVYKTLPSSYISYNKRDDGMYNVYIYANFKKFNNFTESVLDRCTFLKLPWYQRACEATDPYLAAEYLIDTGWPGYSYATDPNYVKGIKSLLPNLIQYDLPKEEEYMINEQDASQIIAILSKYFFEMEGNKPVQDYVHHLANEVRKASGQEPTNE